MLALVPVGEVLADNSFTYDGVQYNITGRNTVEVYHNWHFKGEANIPSQVTYNNTTYTVTEMGKYAFDDCSELTGVTLPSTIIRIGHSAFRGCIGLTSFTMPNSVTEMQSNIFEGCTNLKDVVLSENLYSIGSASFFNCTSLANITIPESVRQIYNSAFEGCTSLTKITIPDGVQNIYDWTFANDSNLTSVTIGSGVSGICSYAFAYCYNLEEVTFKSDDKLTTLRDNAFNDCRSLKTIALPNPLTTIPNYAFYNCRSLESITLPNSLTEIKGDAFTNCVNLKSVTLPSTMTAIDGFTNCTSLGSVTFPEGLTSIQGFQNCTSMKSIAIPASVTRIYNAFDGCTGVETATVDADNKYYDSRDNCNCIINSQTDEIIFGCNNSTIPSTVKRITNFGGNQNMTVHIPANVEYIYNGAFRNVGGIVVDAGNATYDSRDNSNCVVETASNTLISACINTTIPNTVTAIGWYSFARIANLKSVSIPSSVTTIGDAAFYDCRTLTDITIPESVTNIANAAFYNCNALESITIPNSVTMIGEEAFQHCVALKSITLSNNLSGIADLAFQECFALTDITLPASVSSIGRGAFHACEALQSINIPDAVRYIGDEAFYGCSSLPSLTLPDSVVSVGQSAFKLNSINGDEEIKVYVRRGTPTLVAYWQGESIELGYNQELCAYEPETGEKLLAPSVSVVKTSPTVVRMKVANYYPEYQYCWIDKQLNVADSVLALTGLTPDSSYYCVSSGIEFQKDLLYVSSDSAKFVLVCDFRTDNSEVSLTAQNPKVVSEGNAVVSAITNLDDAETNVGFEWRRTDWTDDFQSNEGKAYLFAGTMEGYIRRMNTNYMWKYRPFYESNSGTRYYGEWVGIDPTNTSYFEPTIHTYDNVTVDGNSVTLNGYVQCGSDNVTSQGFAYWPNNGNGAKGLAKLTPIVPDDAQTVTAKTSSNSPIMKAELTGLAYNTEYSYVAFVTTSEGETFYGEEQTFKTSGEVTGIINVESGELNAENVPTAIFDLNGRKLGHMQRGLNIVRYSNGTTKKILVK